jgi:NADP-dependent 3-hydroxy acid dehydrogenase YdfG
MTNSVKKTAIITGALGGIGGEVARLTQDGAEVVNMVSDRVRAELLRRIGLTDVLTPRDFTVQSKSAA